MTFRLFYCIAVAAALLTFTYTTAGYAGPAQPAGLDLLRSNKNSQARALFVSAIHANPKDFDGLQGLGTIEEMEDDGAFATHFMTAILSSPNDPRALGDWQDVTQASMDTSEMTSLAPLWAKLEADGSAPAVLRSSALLSIEEKDRFYGNIAGANAIRSKLCFITSWKAIGPFDNASKSGFKKPYGPEIDGVQLASTYPGKNGLSLKWRAMPLVTPDGDCNIGQALSDSKPCVYYAATTLQSASAQSAELWLDPSGATKVWLNGACILSDDIYRFYTTECGEMFSIPVKLKSGANVIVIKSADDDTSYADFSVRFTESDGMTPLPLISKPDSTSSAGTAATDAVAHIPDSEPVAVSLLKAAPPALENLESLARVQDAYSDYDGARATLEKALPLALDYGWLRWQYADVLSDSGQSDDSRTARQAALEDNPDNVVARYYDLSDDSIKLPADEKASRVQHLVKDHPTSTLALQLLADVYKDQSLEDQQIKCLQRATSIHSTEDLESQLLTAYTDSNRVADAQNAYKSMLARTPGADTIWDSFGDFLEGLGRTSEAVAAYRQEIAVGALPIKPLRSIFSAYKDGHKAELATRTMNELIALLPQDAELKADLADEYADSGMKAKAVQLYDEAIVLDPSKVRLRDKVLSLSGEKPTIDLAPAIPGAPLIAAQKSIVTKSKSAVHVLLDESREVVYPDGATDSRKHFIAKILDHSAVDSYSEFPMDVESSTAHAQIRSARVIKPDGKEMYSDTSDSDSISFPSLDVGDIIDVDYEVTDYSSGSLAGNFWLSWQFNEHNCDVDICRLSLITPKGMKFTVNRHGNPPDATTRESGNWTVSEWNAKNLPGLAPEPLAPSGSDALDWIDISNVPTWSTIVAWYTDLANSACTPDDTIRAKAQELTQSDASDADKIKSVVKYVRSLRYQSTPFRLSAYVPTDGKQVIRERYGDCKDKAALICSLLNSLNIEAQMILLSPRDAGVTPFLPSPRFDHAIARIKTADGWQWVDATADQMQYGYLPYEDQDVPALIISDQTKDLSLSPLAQPVAQETITTEKLSLSASGDLAGTVISHYTGNRAWEVRSIMRSVGESRRDQVLQQVSDQFVPGSSYDSGKIDGLDDPDSPVTITITLHAAHYAATAGSLLIVKMPWTTGSTTIYNYLESEKNRVQPIEAAGLRHGETTTINLTLPAGYVPDGLEAPAHGNTPWGIYEYTYTSSGTELVAERKSMISQMRVPTTQISGFEDFMRQRSEQDLMQVVLKKAG